MKKQILYVLLSCFFPAFVIAQVEIDKPLEMTGIYPDNNITGVGTIDVEVGYMFNGSVGTAGQLLRSNGSTGFVPATLSVGDIPAGSGHYIHNQTGTNQSAGFRISGDGIFSNGNVGIGTTNPGAKLEVRGETHLNVMPGHQDEGVIRIGRADGTARYHLIKAFNSSTQASNYLRFAVHDGNHPDGVTDVMSLAGNGNVGIGTNNPSARLHVNGSIRFQSITNGYIRTDGSGNLTAVSTIPSGDITEVDPTWSGAANTSGTISRTGDVGIGTTSPAEKLHVNGNIRAVNFLNLDDGNNRMSIGLGPLTDGLGNTADSDDTYIRTRFRSSSSSHNIHTVFMDAGGIKMYGPSETGEIFRIQPNGDVGIGTNNPERKLHVTGDARVNTLRIGEVGHGTSWPGIANNALGNSSGQYAIIQNSSGRTLVNAASGQSIGFRIANNDRMIVASNGNIGIGTTNPTEKLHIAEAGNLWLDGTGSGVIGLGHGIRSSNRAELHLHANGENNVSEIMFGHNARENNNIRWAISDRGQSNGQLHFYEGPSLAGSFSARMTILSGGNVGIGNSSPSFLLDVNGNTRITTTAGTDIIFDQSGIDPTVRPSTDAFGLSGTSTHSWWRVYSRAFVNTSDMRLKSDIRNSNYGLKEVMQMRPVSYKWIERPESGEKIGFIAQEILDIIPEVVAIPENSDENYGISYTELIPVLVNAMQEQQGFINKHEATIKEQQSLINQLISDIEQLKSK